VNFLFHTSLGNILLVVSSVMFSLIEGSTLVSRWIRSVWNEGKSGSHSGVERRDVLLDELLNLFVVASLSNVLLVMLVVMSPLA